MYPLVAICLVWCSVVVMPMVAARRSSMPDKPAISNKFAMQARGPAICINISLCKRGGQERGMLGRCDVFCFTICHLTSFELRQPMDNWFELFGEGGCSICKLAFVYLYAQAASANLLFCSAEFSIMRPKGIIPRIMAGQYRTEEQRTTGKASSVKKGSGGAAKHQAEGTPSLTKYFGASASRGQLS